MVVQSAVDEVVASTSGVMWSVAIARDGVLLGVHEPDRVLPTASMGKVFLLLRAAELIVAGDLDGRERLSPEGDEMVGDSGLWQHLDEPSLSVTSLCILAGSVSDNTATNVLLRRIGLESVTEVSARLGMPETAMLDRIRDRRASGDPRFPSAGSARDLCSLMHRVATDAALGHDVDRKVREWLALNVDTSMVASAFACDPLAHADGPLFNKTGTDLGVRADAGRVQLPSGTWAYAALATWEGAAGDRSGDVLAAMRRLGVAIQSQT